MVDAYHYILSAFEASADWPDGKHPKWPGGTIRRLPSGADVYRSTTGALVESWPRLKDWRNHNLFDYGYYYNVLERRWLHRGQCDKLLVYDGQAREVASDEELRVTVKQPEIRVHWADERRVILELPGECGGGGSREGGQLSFNDHSLVYASSHRHALQGPMMRIERALTTMFGQTLDVRPWNNNGACPIRVTRTPKKSSGTLTGTTADHHAVMHDIVLDMSCQRGMSLRIGANYTVFPAQRPFVYVEGSQLNLRDFVPYFMWAIFLPALGMLPIALDSNFTSVTGYGTWGDHGRDSIRASLRRFADEDAADLGHKWQQLARYSTHEWASNHKRFLREALRVTASVHLRKDERTAYAMVHHEADAFQPVEVTRDEAITAVQAVVPAMPVVENVNFQTDRAWESEYDEWVQLLEARTGVTLPQRPRTTQRSGPTELHLDSRVFTFDRSDRRIPPREEARVTGISLNFDQIARLWSPHPDAKWVQFSFPQDGIWAHSTGCVLRVIMNRADYWGPDSPPDGFDAQMYEVQASAGFATFFISIGATGWHLQLMEPRALRPACMEREVDAGGCPCLSCLVGTKNHILPGSLLGELLANSVCTAWLLVYESTELPFRVTQAVSEPPATTSSRREATPAPRRVRVSGEGHDQPMTADPQFRIEHSLVGSWTSQRVELPIEQDDGSLAPDFTVNPGLAPLAIPKRTPILTGHGERAWFETTQGNMYRAWNQDRDAERVTADQIQLVQTAIGSIPGPRTKPKDRDPAASGSASAANLAGYLGVQVLNPGDGKTLARDKVLIPCAYSILAFGESATFHSIHILIIALLRP